MQKLKVVKIEWVDSCSGDNWEGFKESEEHTIAKCESVGYLLRKDKEQVQIVQNISDNGHLCAQIAIPRGCIKKITYLDSEGIEK